MTAPGGAADAPLAGSTGSTGGAGSAGTGVAGAAAMAGQSALGSAGRTTDALARTGAVTRAWDAVEATLQTAVPDAPPSAPDRPVGQALVRALRQRDLITLDQGHALLDLLALAERARQSGVTLAEADMTAARDALARLAGAAAVAAAASGQTGVPSPGAAPSPAPPGPGGWSASGSAASAGPILAGLLVAVVVVGAIAFALRAGAGGGLIRSVSRIGSARSRGIAAYGAGRLDEARTALRQAAVADSTDPLPHAYLGRIARETGDLTTARTELTTAVRLGPTDPTALREMGALQLATGHPELARRFYVRAVSAAPDDRGAQGWLACSLTRVGRTAEAARFFQRAGPGPWTACAGDSTGSTAPGPAGPAPAS